MIVVAAVCAARARGGGGQNSAYGSLRSFCDEMAATVSESHSHWTSTRYEARAGVRGATLALRGVDIPWRRRVRRTAARPDPAASGRGARARVSAAEHHASTSRDSMLVVPEHSSRARSFRSIDIHGHPPTPMTVGAVRQSRHGDGRAESQVMVNVNGTFRRSAESGRRRHPASRYKDRMVMFASLDLRDRGAWLRGDRGAAARRGCKGWRARFGEIFKDLGMFVKKIDGSRLHVDDPELDPVWEALRAAEDPGVDSCRRAGRVFRAARLSKRALARARAVSGSPAPDRRALRRADDRARTAWSRGTRRRSTSSRTSVGTQTTWRALGKMLDDNPNVYYDVAAVLYDFGRQPRAAHAFFVKYQDRILFGKDSYQPDEYPYYWRVFETNDEYFDYYRDYHAFWKLYGIGLPDEVLQKLYYQECSEAHAGPAARRLSHVGPPHRLEPEPSDIGSAFAPDLYTMAFYLVTGGAGFIGSHLAEELVRRGHRVRVVDSLITGKRRNLDHIPGVEFIEGDLADLAVAQAAVNGVELRAAPGRDSVGAAFGQGSDHVESRQHRRIDQRPRRGARRRREASGLRRIVLGVRQHADAAEARRHGDEPTLALRAAETRRRAIRADVHTPLQLRNRDHRGISTCSGRGRIRGRRIRASSRCSRPRCSRDASRSSTATASRRATSRTWRTSSTACCEPARRRMRPGR